MEQLVLDMGLMARPTLDNFLGDDNAMALDYLRFNVARPYDSGTRNPVPVLLWGESGSGKSHLLHAVRDALVAQGEAVGWLAADTPAPLIFHEEWSAILMDDCDLYRPDLQAAAFSWFVQAQAPASGRPRWIVATSSLPPADMPVRDDLRTRLAWGHVFKLEGLPETTRQAVLQQAAQARGLDLPDDVVRFMLSRFSRDLSSLMVLLDHLDSYALQTQRPITIPLLKAMLAQA